VTGRARAGSRARAQRTLAAALAIAAACGLASAPPAARAADPVVDGSAAAGTGAATGDSAAAAGALSDTTRAGRIKAAIAARAAALARGDSAAAIAASRDSAAAVETARESVEAKPGAGFHPTYEVKYSIEKDVRAVSNAVRANYDIGEHLKVSNATSVRSKDEQTLKRKATTQTSATNLEYSLSDGTSMGVSYHATRSFDTNRSQALETETRTTASSVGVFSKLNRQLTDSLRFTADASAGTNHSDFRDVTESGTRGDLSMGLDYAPARSVKTAFTWAGTRETNDAEHAEKDTVGGRPIDILVTDTNRDISQAITGRASYTPKANLRLNLDLGANNGRFQYPEGTTKRQETRAEDRWSAALQTAYDRTERLAFQFNLSRDQASKDYSIDIDTTNIFALEDSARAKLLKKAYEETRRRPSDILRSEAKATLNYKGWRGGAAKLALARDQSEETYSDTPQSKRLNHGGILLGLDQKLSGRLSTSLSARIDLTAFEYDLEESRENDRDVVSRSAEFNTSYAFAKNVSSSFNLGVREDRTVNIASKRVRENNSKQSWWVRPSFTFSPSEQVKINQAYEVRNDFTIFDLNESRNFLTRKTQVDTGFSYRVTKKVSFDASHQYQLRGEGSYDRRNDILFRTSQASRQSLDLSTGYSPRTGFRVAFGERIEANRNYEFLDGRRVKKPGASGESVRRQFFGEMNLTHEVSKKLSVKLNGRQTQTLGTNVSELEKRFYVVDTAVEYKL